MNNQLLKRTKEVNIICEIEQKMKCESLEMIICQLFYVTKQILIKIGGIVYKE